MINIKIRAPVVSRLSPVGVGGRWWRRPTGDLGASRVKVTRTATATAPWRCRSRVPSSRHPDTRQDKCRRVGFGFTAAHYRLSRGHQAWRRWRRRAEEDRDDARVPGSTAFSWRRRTTVFTIRLPEKPVRLFGDSFRATGAAQTCTLINNNNNTTMLTLNFRLRPSSGFADTIAGGWFREKSPSPP